MKKINIVALIVVLPVFWSNLYSQKQVEDGLFKINALAQGVSYEFGVGDKSTVNLEAIIGFAVNGSSNRDTEFGIFPGIQAEYRNYLNFDRRLRKDKDISGN